MRDRFQAHGNVACYLEKPFDPKSLRERITTTLAQKK
jgi:DNA-binding response OmpR family regulator